MAGRDVVVVGASAGGVEALLHLVGGLPPDLPAALFVVLHLPADARSLLARILARAGPLPVATAVDGESIQRGRIYVARPNHHLLLERGRVRVLAGPHEHGLRPAVDPLFRSAARAYGRRVVGVVLSGTGDDGTAGLEVIKRHGGCAVVQTPADALAPGMPRHALARTTVDYCVAAGELPAILVALAQAPIRGPDGRVDDAQEGDQVRMTAYTAGSGDADGPGEVLGGPGTGKREGQASGFTCPECHGSLWEVEDGDQVRFECRVDHRYSFESALAEQARTVEAAHRAALNVLEERGALLRKQGQRARDRGHEALAARFATQAQDADAHADTIRTSLLGLVQSLATEDGEELPASDGEPDADGTDGDRTRE
jgi:two-component system, chemotaxis family, protein-glutamate methylesterase/glutaminase